MSQSLARNLRRKLRGPLIKALLHVFARLPLPLNHRIGAGIGRLLHRYSRELCHVSDTNLRLCLPELDPAARADLVHESLIETGKAMTELGPLWLWERDKLASLVRRRDGEEVLLQAMAQDKGVIMVSPHLGAWEIMGLYLSLEYGITSMYKPPRVAELDSLMRQARERTGARLVPADASGVRGLLQALKNRELVGLLPDQDPGKGGGEFAPFFGVSANTMTLVSRLAQRSGAPVVFCYAERLPAGEGFCLHFAAAPDEIADRDLQVSLKAMNEAVAQMVRQCPAQYEWGYRRFRTRLQGEQGVY